MANRTPKSKRKGPSRTRKERTRRKAPAMKHGPSVRANAPRFASAEEQKSEWRKPGPEHAVEDVRTRYRLFVQEERRSSLHAFEALSLIALACLSGIRLAENAEGKVHSPKISNETILIPVPWWIVDELTDRWGQYFYQPNRSESRKTMEECFGLAGAKPGKHRVQLRQEAIEKERNLVIEIAKLADQDTGRGSVTRSVEVVAEKNNISIETAWKAWKKAPLRKAAKAYAKKLRSIR